MVLQQGAEDELKHAVALVRPVSVAFEVVRDFSFYKAGVYTSETCGTTPMVSTCSYNLIKVSSLLLKCKNYFQWLSCIVKSLD